MQNPFSRDNPFVLKEKSRLNNSCSSGSILTTCSPSLMSLENNYFHAKQLRKRGRLPNPFFKKHLLSNLENSQEQKQFGDIQYILLSSNFRDSRNNEKYAQNDRGHGQPQQLIANIPIPSTNRIELNRIEMNRMNSKRSAAHKETDRQEREIIEKVELSVEMNINQQARKELKEKFIESRKQIELEEAQIRLRGKVYTRCQVLVN